MTDQAAQMFKNTALLFSKCVSAQARIEGMKVFNLERERQGQAPGYDEDAFENVIIEFGIGWNDAVITLNNV